MPISHVDVPAAPFRSPASAAAAASRLIRSWDAAHWTIGRRCQDSARQRPRKEIKCLNSLALSNPFSVFSLCSEFTYQEIHKYCSRFDLLTHALNVCPSSPAWLPGAQQLVVIFGPLRLTPFGWVSPLLLLARVPRSVRLPLCSIIFSLSHPRQAPIFSFQSGRLLTRSAVISLLQDIVRLVGLPFHSFKRSYFSHRCRLYSRCCRSARLAD